MTTDDPFEEPFVVKVISGTAESIGLRAGIFIDGGALMSDTGLSLSRSTIAISGFAVVTC